MSQSHGEMLTEHFLSLVCSLHFTWLLRGCCSVFMLYNVNCLVSKNSLTYF